MSQSENINYRGALLKVRKYARGWRVFVTLPNSNLRENYIHVTAEEGGREMVIGEAKDVVFRKTL
jgi:hypothetical protein